MPCISKFEIQSDLVESYRQDFSKYAPYTDKRSLNYALNAVAKNIGHQIKYTQLSAEVDYLITRNNKIYPVEIKGGASGRLRSMHMILKQYPHIEQGYVLSTAPFGKIPRQKLTFLPLYYAYRLSMADSTPGSGVHV